MPVFFITSGIRLDLTGLRYNPSALVRVPVTCLRYLWCAACPRCPACARTASGQPWPSGSSGPPRSRSPTRRGPRARKARPGPPNASTAASTRRR